MIKRIFMMTSIFTALLASEPSAYKELQEVLKADLNVAQQVVKYDHFIQYSGEVAALEDCLQKAAAKAGRGYLKALRRCERKSKKFDGHYITALREAVSKDDVKLFEQLLRSDPRILQRSRWMEKEVAFYEKHREEYPFAAGEKLLNATQEEAMYRERAAQEMQNYEADVKVLSYSEAKHSRDKEGRARTFFVGYQKRDGVTTLIAENNNAYPVTLLVHLKRLSNYRVDKPNPYHVEVDPHAKLEVMHLFPKDRSKRSGVAWQYSWVMGRAELHHDRSYLYALPFRPGSRVIVSQGFGGQSTHTGKSRYAVDFVADEGTRIYAARGGKVIATEDAFDKGGFDLSFGQYANYITIEHTDHTMGKYYHLQQYGVKVKVGQYVTKGQFIGLSGNTGYSSGPHLHFGVYKVDSDYRSITTIPFRFQTDRGVVDAPKQGDIFRVVR